MRFPIHAALVAACVVSPACSLSAGLGTHVHAHHRSARASAPTANADKPPDLEKVTEKFGLEAGLFSALKSAGGGEGGGSMAKAGDLLKRYGGAYLLTSTSLALVSFGLCYVAIENGVDVASLLERLNIEVSSTSEAVGTVGLAYAVHKAASPIRFPPTVALTPIVAKKLFGREEEDETP